MNNTRNTILACVDGSALSEAVVDYAAWISRTVDNPLKLLHNLDHRHIPRPDLSGSIGLGSREALLEELTALEARTSKLLQEQGKLLLDGARQRAVEQGAREPAAVQRHGSLGESLVELEDEIRVLVLGVRGEDHEGSESRIGAQLETVIRSMHRPVLVVNREFSSAPSTIMLAFDGNEPSRKCLEMVATSPLYKRMHCHLVHVGRNETEATSLLDTAAGQLELGGLRVSKAWLRGDVGRNLLDYQREHGIDMTVMGAFGQSRLRELLFGSVTVKMLCSSQVPLLLLR